MIRTFVLIGVSMALATTSASAQRRHDAIPRDQVPPRGLCRVWLDDRPVWRQPSATDCATAQRTAPPDSRIIHTASNGRVTIVPRVARNDRYDDRDYDRRADPRSPYYDARYDRNSRYYDPRLASRDRDDDRERWERQREREQERRRREWERERERERRDRDAVYRSRVSADSRDRD